MMCHSAHHSTPQQQRKLRCSIELLGPTHVHVFMLLLPQGLQSFQAHLFDSTRAAAAADDEDNSCKQNKREATFQAQGVIRSHASEWHLSIL